MNRYFRVENIKSVSVLLIILIPFLFLFSEASFSEVSAFNLLLQGNKPSIHAEQVPLQNILGQLSAHGIDVKIDPLGHGTQMVMLAAGMIKPYGVEMDQAYHNPIIPVRIFDENGYTSNFHVMKSIAFALENGARVISLSWGSEVKSDFLEDQLTLAGLKGDVIVAAGGNEPTGKPVYPAAYDSVIGVGALGPDGRVWGKSNYGESVMFYAPGYASFPIGYKGDPGSYAGNSISTAFIANLFADYLSRNPDATRQNLLNVLNRK